MTPLVRMTPSVSPITSGIAGSDRKRYSSSDMTLLGKRRRSPASDTMLPTRVPAGSSSWIWYRIVFSDGRPLDATPTTTSVTGSISSIGVIMARHVTTKSTTANTPTSV